MKIAAFEADGERRHGVVIADELLPLPAGSDLFALLDDGPDERSVLSRCNAPVPLSRVRLLAPVQPPTVRDFVTFEEHVEGVRRSVDGAAGVPEQWYAAPTFYFTNPYSILGPADDVPVPPGCVAFDFELEVAAVIGRAGRDLTPDRARDHILGYTIMNDWSARERLRRRPASSATLSTHDAGRGPHEEGTPGATAWAASFSASTTARSAGRSAPTSQAA
jgi:2-keto-4-pentenoate hydratase/2-oxohepta-3-ene-1,7-dioic acid hydratase in catechol pathway